MLNLVWFVQGDVCLRLDAVVVFRVLCPCLCDIDLLRALSAFILDSHCQGYPQPARPRPASM